MADTLMPWWYLAIPTGVCALTAALFPFQKVRINKVYSVDATEARMFWWLGFVVFGLMTIGGMIA